MYAYNGLWIIMCVSIHQIFKVFLTDLEVIITILIFPLYTTFALQYLPSALFGVMEHKTVFKVTIYNTTILYYCIRIEMQ